MGLLRTTSARALIGDSATAVAFSLLVLAELRLHWDDGHQAGGLLLNLPLLLLITLSLVLRRRAPWVALGTAFAAAVVPSFVVAHTLFFFGSLLPLGLLVYSAARYAERSALLVLLAPAALLVVYPLHLRPFDGADYAFGAVLFGAAWGTGRLVRRLERQRLLLADALAAQERERAARERALLLDERARIARELHDVVAHAVSVMVVQAGAARFALGADEDEVRERLLSVEETGRTAVRDLRRLLELLRAEDEEDGGPQPGLAQLPTLVDELQKAGLPVRAEIDPPPASLPAALDVTAYRVVQEALTNVLRHSDAQWAALEVRVTDDVLVLQVADGGPPRPRSSERLSTGHGLVGMRERAGLFGGALAAGPCDGGWRVRAELPLSRTRVGAER